MPASPELSPGLIVIHGNHLEELRALAVQWMRRYPLRPLENEVLLVQSNGIAQWLKLALAERDGCGIAAALDVDLPGWTEDLVDELTDSYEDDMERLAAMPGVTFLTA